MNWSIEQNYILLKFVRAYGETEWCKRTNELRDMFSVYLTNISDMEINNFNEEDFRRQYNYILATTRQECLKQGVKLIKSGELVDIALKKFYTYLEQQNKEDGGQMDERLLRLLYDNDLGSIGPEQISAMREKIYRIVGEDLMGMAYGLERLEGVVQRDACINEMSQSWIRRLSDGRVCVAGDTDIFPHKLLSELYEAAKISDIESDSDATDTLEEPPVQKNNIQVISFQEALDAAELSYLPALPARGEQCGWLQKYGNRKVIPGWDLTDVEDRKELDDQLQIWEESLKRPSVSTDINFDPSLQSSEYVHQPVDEPRCISPHCSSPSSASTQEAFTSRLVFPTPDSYEMTTGSPSADTALSHATVDDLDEPSSIKESPVVKRKRRARLNSNVSSTKKFPGINKESDNKRKIMRNITKMIMDHPYSSIFVKSIREDTGIYRHETLTISKISHDVIDGDFASYEHFIEVIILFFLQMKIYYLGDKETVKKIESVYADVSKQLSIIYPDLNDTLPLSDLFQRRQKRFKGNYA